MDIGKIVAELRAERDRLNEAIAALEGLNFMAPRSRQGRRVVAAKSTDGRRRRHLSAAARKRISQTMKARWAERKRKTKGT